MFSNLKSNCYNAFYIWETSKFKRHSVSKIVLTFHCLNKLFQSFSLESQKFFRNNRTIFLKVGQNNFGNRICIISIGGNLQIVNIIDFALFPTHFFTYFHFRTKTWIRLHPWYLWPWIGPELKANSCLILTRLRNPKSKLMGRKWTNMSVIYVTKCFSGLKIWQNIENVWCALPLPNTNESNVIEIRYLQSLWIQLNRYLYLPSLWPWMNLEPVCNPL